MKMIKKRVRDCNNNQIVDYCDSKQCENCKFFIERFCVLRLPKKYLSEEVLDFEIYVLDRILTNKEKEYLSNVIKPFRDEVEYIFKNSSNDGEFISIRMKNGEDTMFPTFPKNKYYEGMVADNVFYTIEELDL